MRSVRWSDRAARSQAEIFGYLAERNPEAAHRVIGQILDAGDALGIYSTGRPGEVAGTYLKSLPRLHYVLYYRIDKLSDGEQVVILDIVHTRRDWVPGDLPPKAR